jgi:hypothetical protein
MISKVKRLFLLAFVSILSVMVIIPPNVAFAATLNTHTVVLDSSGKIVPWTSNPADGYDTVVNLAWNYLLNKVPNDPATGLPAYLSQSYLNPDTQQMAGWPHNPAGLYAMLIESAQEYYDYSGNAAVMTVAQNVANRQLQGGMTPATYNWANVPYASGDASSLTYQGAAYGNTTGVGDGQGVLQPDKIGELGVGFIKLYEYSGNTKYRDAAINAAEALAGHIRTGDASHSPWPYRAVAQTGAAKEEYSAHVIAPIELFDELIRLGIGNTASYQSARTTTWNWMMAYPMQNNVWTQYFEDVAIQSDYSSNLNQMNAMMTARYLLNHPEMDPNWETHVRGLIAWTESHFAASDSGVTTIKEQNAFAYAMGSHTSRYAAVNALLYEKTGDAAAKEKAYRSLNWATYMARSTGVVIDGPAVNNQWFTDGYGDYIRHFMVSMGAVPEWAPANQTHLVHSSSVIKSITYSAGGVSYTSSDTAAEDTLKLAFVPSSVTVDGQALAQRSDPSQPGWSYDSATGVLKLRHVTGTMVQIASGAPGDVAPSVSLVSPTNGSTYTEPATVSLQATASDSDGTVTKVDFYRGSTLIGSDASAPYTATWSNVAAGTYNITAVATDNQGAATSTPAATITVNAANSLPSPWNSADVGQVGVTGSASYSNGTFTLKGSGVDIWDAADSFRYAYQPLNGDGQITARVASQQNTDPWALAGVMVRETLDANSPQALAAITPGNGASFTWRSTIGAASSYTNGNAATVPYWVRLKRSGNTFTAYKSADGTNWTQYAQATITMGSTAYVGLAVTSHNNAVLATDTFDNVSVSGSADTTPPVVSAVSASNISQNGANISWTTNEAADSQVEYGTSSAYGSSTALNTTLDTSHTQVVAGLNANTTYHYRVKSRDAAGNLATSGDLTFVTPGAPDTAAPSVPAGLVAGTVTAGSVPLSWSASTDDVGVTGYQILRDGTQIGTSGTTNFTDSSVASSTTYSYTVKAYDAAGNVSAGSTPPLSVTTPAPSTNPITADKTVTTKQTTSATSITSPSLTTAAPNELLVAFISSDGPASGQSISAVTGGSLTWTLRKRANTQAGTSEIWTAYAPTVLTNITVKATRSSGSYQGMITVAAFQNASSAIGATASASGSTGAPTVGLTTTGVNSLVYGVGDDWDAATARTVGSGQTKVDEFLSPSGDTFWLQRQTNAIAAGGTAVTINDTAPTNHRWNLAAIEIVQAP